MQRVRFAVEVARNFGVPAVVVVGARGSGSVIVDAGVDVDVGGWGRGGESVEESVSIVFAAR